MAKKQKRKTACGKGWRRSYTSKRYVHCAKSGIKRPKARYHKASIRSKRIGKHGRLLLTGCPKRYWRVRKKRCDAGLQAFAMLVPKKRGNPPKKPTLAELRAELAKVRAGLQMSKWREKARDLHKLYAQRNPKSATAVSYYMELVERGVFPTMAARIARRQMLPFYGGDDYLTIARVEKSIMARGNASLRMRRAKQAKAALPVKRNPDLPLAQQQRLNLLADKVEKDKGTYRLTRREQEEYEELAYQWYVLNRPPRQSLSDVMPRENPRRPVKRNDRTRFPVWWKVYTGSGRARASVKLPHDPQLAMDAAQKMYPDALLRLKRVDDGLEIGGEAEDALEEELG